MLFCFTVLVKLRNFSNSWSRPKDIRLFWLLNYNGLHKNTHHYGPSDPVGSFCGIAEKQLSLITYVLSGKHCREAVSFHFVSVSSLLLRWDFGTRFYLFTCSRSLIVWQFSTCGIIEKRLLGRLKSSTVAVWNSYLIRIEVQGEDMCWTGRGRTRSDVLYALE